MKARCSFGDLISRNWEKPNKETLTPTVVAINKRFISGRKLFISAIVKQKDINNLVKIINALRSCLQVIQYHQNYEIPFSSTLPESDPIRALDNTIKEVKKRKKSSKHLDQT